MARRDSDVMLDRQRLPVGGSVLVRRMVVAIRAELTTAGCDPRGDGFRTAQWLCYPTNLAIGAVIGLDTRGNDISVAV